MASRFGTELHKNNKTTSEKRFLHSRTCNLRGNWRECKLFIRSILKFHIISVHSLATVNKTAPGCDFQNWRVYFFNRLKSLAIQDHVQLNTCAGVGDCHCPFWFSLHFNTSWILGYGEILQRASLSLTHDGKEENEAKNHDGRTSHCGETNANFDSEIGCGYQWICLSIL